MCKLYPLFFMYKSHSEKYKYKDDKRGKIKNISNKL